MELDKSYIFKLYRGAYRFPFTMPKSVFNEFYEKLTLLDNLVNLRYLLMS